MTGVSYMFRYQRIAQNVYDFTPLSVAWKSVTAVAPPILVRLSLTSGLNCMKRRAQTSPVRFIPCESFIL